MVFCWCPEGGENGFWIGKYEVTVAQKYEKKGLTLDDGTVLSPDQPAVMVDRKAIYGFLRQMNERGRKSGLCRRAGNTRFRPSSSG